MKTTATFRKWLADIGGRLDGTALYLYDTSVTDLTPLKGMELELLYLHNTQVTDLTPLKGMKLTALSLWGTPAAKKPLPEWLDESIVIR